MWWLFLIACAPPSDGGMEAPNAQAARRVAPVQIHEIMASNRAALLVQGATPDWVELAGPPGTSLNGYTLSDGGPGFALSGLALDDAGFVLLYADGQPELGPGHLDFQLAADGEELVLTGPSGRIVDHVRWSEALPDVSMARSGLDPTRWGHVALGSPGEANAAF